MKTHNIFNLTTPYDNPYQGNDKKLLFVCSAGMLRSPTAADIATKLGYNARSCGSSSVALIPLSINLISWADSIFFMSNENYKEAIRNFKHIEVLLKEKSIIWNIPDVYNRNDTELIEIIKQNLLDLKGRM